MSSITSVPAIGPSIHEVGEAVVSARWRSTVQRTTSALNGEPSWKLTPSRSVKVTVLPSFENSHLVARPG